MKISDTPSFQNTPPLQHYFTNPSLFYGKNLNPTFLGKFRKLTPPPLYKLDGGWGRGASNYDRCKNFVSIEKGLHLSISKLFYSLQ